MNKKQNELFVNLILILIFLVGLVFNILVFINLTKKTDKEEKNNNVSIQNTNSEGQNENTVNKGKTSIEDMNETDRMLNYINKFLTNIENEDYSKSYSYLNDEFKDNYFKTEDDFKQYAIKNFTSENIAIKYNNIERLGNPIKGNIYVVYVEIYDFLNGNENDETKFVILEKDYDNFEMSFNVKN